RAAASPMLGAASDSNRGRTGASRMRWVRLDRADIQTLPLLTGEVDRACGPVDYLRSNLSAARQPFHDRVELIEVANLQGEQAPLAQPAQLEVGLQAERFFDALLQRLCVGALG